ncbi:hypothetical protein ABMA28_000311 [Loxostege sticticalis]|uniref:Uncharacterized protein n=1 Tax=Loxostege sticticalis TaxID=481309 RepID=A0ABD0TRS2_LOXSC
MRPRPGRAPTHLRTEDLLFFLSALLLLTPANCFPSSAQLYVVCKDADSNTCVTWPVDFETATKLARQFYGPDDCGLSDLKPIPPHRKFIAVKHFSDMTSRFFCNAIKIQTAEQVIPFENVTPEIVRTRRQTNNRLRGRYRGQTQSQYLSIDRGNGKDDGKAEAHSAADSSRAIVTGNSGMGQAQSQTVYDPSCEDCISRSDTELASLARGPNGPGNRQQGTYNPDFNNGYNRQGQIPGTSFRGSNGDGSAPNTPGSGQNINGQNLPQFTTNQQKPHDNNYLTNQPGGMNGHNGIPQYSTHPGQQGGNGILNNGKTPNQPPGVYGRPDGSSNQQLPPENIINRGVPGSNLQNRPGLINQQQPPNANNQWTNGLPNGNIDMSRIPGNVNRGQGPGGVPSNIPNGYQQTPNNVYTSHQTGLPNGGVLPNQNTLSQNNLPTQSLTPNGNTLTNYPGSAGGGSGGPNNNNQGNPFSWPVLSDILRQRGAGSTYFCCVELVIPLLANTEEQGKLQQANMEGLAKAQRVNSEEQDKLQLVNTESQVMVLLAHMERQVKSLSVSTVGQGKFRLGNMEVQVKFRLDNMEIQGKILLANMEEQGGPLLVNTEEPGRPLQANMEEPGRPLQANMEEPGKPLLVNMEERGRPHQVNMEEQARSHPVKPLLDIMEDPAKSLQGNMEDLV